MDRSIFVLLSVVAAFGANHARAEPSCPSPSVAQGGQCVLNADATISDTIWVPSGTHLNCRGHRITPLLSGMLDDPRTTANEFQPSQPELALFAHQAYGVTIQDCAITGFDFGILVARSKTADALAGKGTTRNRILGNTIDVRTNAIDVIKSDHVLISDNVLTYASERGRGLVIDYDSDHNTVTGNNVISTDAASTGQVRQLPGGPFVTSTAIMDNEIHCLQSDKPLQNFVVSGVLFQVASNDPLADFEDSGRSDHNLVEANTIVDLGVGPTCTLDPGVPCRMNTDCTGKGGCLLKQNSGIGFNLRAGDSMVRGNRISGRMERGISLAGTPTVTTLAGWYPGSCSLDSGRMCSTNADCSIPSHDSADTGPCIGAAPATFNGNSIGLTAEDNVLDGTYDTAVLFANNVNGFVFRRNSVDGGASGIRISGATNGLIERNVVSGSLNALYVGFQSPFTTTTRLNDFTDYVVAIRTSNDFSTVTDVSADKGNYWGLPCPGFDPSRVAFENGTVNPFVFDGKPYGEPVARTPANRLPTRCQ